MEITTMENGGKVYRYDQAPRQTGGGALDERLLRSLSETFALEADERTQVRSLLESAS